MITIHIWQLLLMAVLAVPAGMAFIAVKSEIGYAIDRRRRLKEIAFEVKVEELIDEAIEKHLQEEHDGND